jgi:ABC-type nitrate/sulfonate/bicarbonate transport system ATPase subunit
METGRTEILKVEHLCHSYDRLEVLEDITFSVYQGEIVCILGPSGCGKTTLLRILAGLVPSRQGSVKLLGHDMGENAASRQHIGMVFQEPRLLPWRTTTDNVGLPFELRGEERGEAEEAAISAALNMVSLPEFTSAFPHQLSGGMRQRVALARALVTNPAVLLLDEPLTGLDMRTREELQDEITAIRAQTRKSMIWVTHDPQEAVYLADRIIVLSGRPASIRGMLEVYSPHPRLRSDPAAAAMETRIRALFS